MAVLWQYSLVPWTDPSGDPYSGALAYFFDVNTTTPQIVYTDAGLSITHDHPVEADSGGKFPAVFFPDESSHRLRITDADGATIWDVDNISVPTTTPIDIPTSDTPTEFLFQTGDLKWAYRTSSPTGWVRANGRTVGAAASGATERANADAEDLFIHLWEEDASLAVSGGRGGTSAGDWAANKTIVLPDLRGRALIGMDSMGNSAAGRVTDAVLGEDSDGLGSVGGEQTHALVSGELAAHTHPGTTDSDGLHGHPVRLSAASGGGSTGSGGALLRDGAQSNYPAFTGTPADTIGQQIGGGGAHTHAFTTASTGSGTAHNNMQPSMVAIALIKL